MPRRHLLRRAEAMERYMKRRVRSLVRRYAPPGSAPGTLLVDPEAAPPVIRVITYGPVELEEATLGSVDELDAWMGRHAVTWVNVDGLGHHDTLKALGERFDLHRLALEDAVNTGQRAKVEPYEGHLFLVARFGMPGTRDTEQITIVLGGDTVLTLQERPGDCFEGVRRRLREASGRIRQFGADYLVYALLDAVVDSYFPVLEELSEELDGLEDEVLGDPDSTTLIRIHAVKRDLVALRKAIWPHRDMLNTLLRESEDFVTETRAVYLRDVYDHAIRIIDLVEAFREVATDLMGAYMSAVSNRMNEIMKVLTIIATVFIPLSFIAGVYGMNFDPAVSPWNMPELQWRLGYPFALGLMTAAAGGLLWFVWRRGWFR